MKILFNEKGSILIMFSLFTGLVVSLAIASVLLASRKASSEGQMLRSYIYTQSVIEQLGIKTLNAYRVYKENGSNGGCPSPAGDYTFKSGLDETNLQIGFCFPSSLCISDPASDAEDAQICSGEPPYAFELLSAKVGLQVLNKETPAESKTSNYVNHVLKKMNDVFTYLQDTINAQSALDNNFAGTAAPSPSTLDLGPSACTGTLCKTCDMGPPSLPGNEKLPCVRFRICPHMGNCDPAAPNMEWVVQKIGILIGPADPQLVAD